MLFTHFEKILLLELSKGKSIKDISESYSRPYIYINLTIQDIIYKLNMKKYSISYIANKTNTTEKYVNYVINIINNKNIDIIKSYREKDMNIYLNNAIDHINKSLAYI